jgi:hypothetical protein
MYEGRVISYEWVLKFLWEFCFSYYFNHLNYSVNKHCYLLNPRACYNIITHTECQWKNFHSNHCMWQTYIVTCVHIYCWHKKREHCITLTAAVLEQFVITTTSKNMFYIKVYSQRSYNTKSSFSFHLYKAPKEVDSVANTSLVIKNTVFNKFQIQCKKSQTMEWVYAIMCCTDFKFQPFHFSTNFFKMWQPT